MAMKIIRWIAVVPAGIIAAAIVTFPLHLLIILMFSGEKPYWGLLTAETLERLAMAFTTPFVIIYVGAWTAPTRRFETGIALAVAIALILGGIYVFAFTGDTAFSGWYSLHYGATPVLNLVAIATALFIVRRNLDSVTA